MEWPAILWLSDFGVRPQTRDMLRVEIPKILVIAG